MIKFFRKIRQKLLTENKFSKYLIYAIGEIILVMVGILLALQVNNWNEERKIERRKIEVSKSVVQELKEVYCYTETQIDWLNSRITYFTKIIDEWETFAPEKLSEKELLYYYWAVHTSTLVKYTPRIDYYSSLIGSGEISMIADSSVVRLNYAYNSLRNDVVTYVNQEVDLHISIAEVVAKNHSEEFLSANAKDEVYGQMDTASMINFLNSVKTDGELKSLIIRNLTILKWKRHLLKSRVIPELEILLKSFDSD